VTFAESVTAQPFMD